MVRYEIDGAWGAPNLPASPADDVALLLPWHAAGALGPSDHRRVEAALACNRALARDYAEICRERLELRSINQKLGAPSARAMTRLFDAIALEAAQAPGHCVR